MDELDQAEVRSNVPSQRELLWSIRLSALYHLKRERFLDGIDRAAKGIAALGGAAAFSQLKNNPDIGLWVIGTITLVSTLSLVYGPSAKARKHAELARDFRRLEASVLELGNDLKPIHLAKFHGQCVSLESSEPAALGALVTQCHNELCAGEGSVDQITPLPILDRLFKNWFDIDQTPKMATRNNVALISSLFTIVSVAALAYFWREKLILLLQIL